MYHIGSDKRRIQSARLICNGLDKLLYEHTYRSITVTRLAEVAGVGRATFYRLFDGKADVMLYLMEQVFDDLLARFGPESRPEVVLKTLLGVWLEHKQLFLVLIEAGLYEDFQRSLSDVMEKKLGFIG
jgi:AcrR family transcriptional regulator